MFFLFHIAGIFVSAFITLAVLSLFGYEIYGKFAVQVVQLELIGIIVGFGFDLAATDNLKKFQIDRDKYNSTVLSSRVLIAGVVLVLYVLGLFSVPLFSLLISLVAGALNCNHLIFITGRRRALLPLSYLIGKILILLLIILVSEPNGELELLTILYSLGALIASAIVYIFSPERFIPKISFHGLPRILINTVGYLWTKFISSIEALIVLKLISIKYSGIEFGFFALTLNVCRIGLSSLAGLTTPAYIRVSNSETLWRGEVLRILKIYFFLLLSLLVVINFLKTPIIDLIDMRLEKERAETIILIISRADEILLFLSVIFLVSVVINIGVLARRSPYKYTAERVGFIAIFIVLVTFLPVNLKPTSWVILAEVFGILIFYCLWILKKKRHL